MDHTIYLAMTAAKHVELQQAHTTHNLSNANTTGFKAAHDAFRALPVVVNEPHTGALAHTTATYVVDSTSGYNMTQGSLKSTGNKHDFALATPGFFAVQAADGTEAYTRAGGFVIDNTGTLRTHSGLLILNGDGGPITVPVDGGVEVGPDGMIYSVPLSGDDLTPDPVGQIKLVQPGPKATYRGADGLFRLNPPPTIAGAPPPGPQTAPVDPNVRLQPEALEGSNVDVIDSLMQMVTHSRHFDLCAKLIQTTNEISQHSNKLLTVLG